jgi:8-oxo-dGTP pyrophosphatase MutT (NUDIX family)
MSLIRESDNRNHKAGVIPYYYFDGVLKMLFQVSSDPAFGGPDPMIAKGQVDAGESVDEAAIREAEEELGLVKSNVSNITKAWVGPLTGMQASYTLHVYTCEVTDPDNFVEPHFETERTEWLTPDEFERVGRASQRHIVAEIASKL